MLNKGRAAEQVLVLAVLGVLVLLSLQSAGRQVAGVLESAERQQVALTAAARAHERAVNALAGEQLVVAQAPDALRETPAVRAGRALVAATDVPAPPPVLLGALVLALVVLRRVRLRAERLRRRQSAQPAPHLFRAFSAGATRCADADGRGTVLSPAR